MLNKDDIIKSTGLHPLKVKNIYVFGSRVYGTATDESDYDIIVVANSMNEKTEIVDGSLNLNIHVHTPDKFIRDLKELDMHNLECIFAPDNAKILEKVNYADANFKINPAKMKYAAMNQSFNRFHTAKIKMLDGDYHRGTKSLFHSLRILMFAKQILDHGKIVDFSEANTHWISIKNEIQLDDEEAMWKFFKSKYLPIKIELEKQL